MLPRLVGVSRAAEILYTGRTVDAVEAERIGLITRLFENNSIMLEAAMETAREMLKKNPVGLRVTKESMNHSLGAVSLEAAIGREDLNQSITMTTPGIQEAVKRFIKT